MPSLADLHAEIGAADTSVPRVFIWEGLPVALSLNIANVLGVNHDGILAHLRDEKIEAMFKENNFAFGWVGLRAGGRRRFALLTKYGFVALAARARGGTPLSRVEMLRAYEAFEGAYAFDSHRATLEAQREYIQALELQLAEARSVR